MKTLTAAAVLASVLAVCGAASAAPFHHHHRVRVCSLHHHHRVCRWR